MDYIRFDIYTSKRELILLKSMLASIWVWSR